MTVLVSVPRLKPSRPRSQHNAFLLVFGSFKVIWHGFFYALRRSVLRGSVARQHWILAQFSFDVMQCFVGLHILSFLAHWISSFLTVLSFWTTRYMGLPSASEEDHPLATASWYPCLLLQWLKCLKASGLKIGTSDRLTEMSEWSLRLGLSTMTCEFGKISNHPSLSRIRSSLQAIGLAFYLLVQVHFSPVTFKSERPEVSIIVLKRISLEAGTGSPPIFSSWYRTQLKSPPRSYLPLLFEMQFAKLP